MSRQAAIPESHYRTTGPKIWEDTEGNVDVFVAGGRTGGMITGKEVGIHGIQGIGAGFVPEILDTEIYDQILTVGEEEAYEAAKLLAKEEGVLVGISRENDRNTPFGYRGKIFIPTIV